MFLVSNTPVQTKGKKETERHRTNCLAGSSDRVQGCSSIVDTVHHQKLTEPYSCTRIPAPTYPPLTHIHAPYGTMQTPSMKSLPSQCVNCAFLNNIQRNILFLFLVHGYLNLYCFMYSTPKANVTKENINEINISGFFFLQFEITA